MGSEATTRNDLGRVPLQLTSFVGRKGELAEAKAQFGEFTAGDPDSGCTNSQRNRSSKSWSAS